MTLAFFLAGARSAHEEDRRARQLDDWRKRLVDCLEADAHAEDAELQEQLQGWLLKELRHRHDALDSLLEAYSPPRPQREPRALFPAPPSGAAPGDEVELEQMGGGDLGGDGQGTAGPSR
ncbi:hypothetical protein ACFXPI_02215 [Streptomyces sp. NPDC059104]|uniref:hypothetical protein n=1 Tax=Streptomyces sp. NPDC059104 TaxID=3346729 RepID=UPI0036933256